MSKKSEVNPALVKRLRQVADGVEGSEGTVTLAPQDYAAYKQLGGKAVEGDESGGSVQVPCKDLCAVVKKTPEGEDEPAHAPSAPEDIASMTNPEKGGKKK